MNKEIDFKNIIIYWNPWAGKTIITNMIIDSYYRVYSNVNYYYEWIQINTRINWMKDLQKIKFSERPWVIIIDEWWINLNSRNFMSKQNMEFWELLFLGRKVNCYMVWISQRFKSLDVNQRELADLVIKMFKIRRYGKHPLFIATKEKMIRNQLVFDQEWRIDIISWMKKCKKTYNTLESSKI